jgi:hypothetical protein
MPGLRIDPQENEGTERVVILQLLRGDHTQHWTRAELKDELYDVEPEAIDVALEHLEELGVVCGANDEAWISPCVRHLDDLGMIAL